MNRKTPALVCALCLAAFAPPILAQDSGAVEIARYESQFSQAHLEPARLGDQAGIAVIFKGTDDLHFYARSETAPAPGFNLKILATAQGVTFAEPVFPQWKPFYDLAQEKDIEVYVGDFTVFVPLAGSLEHPVDVTVKISGLACTSQLCLPPFAKTLSVTLDPDTSNSWRQLSVTAAQAPEAPPRAAPSQPERAQTARQSVLPFGSLFYFLLAIAAGLSINIMPCVLPVLPLILIRLIEQSKQSSGRRIAAGTAFCGGIVLFFVAFALISTLVNIWTGAVLDLNSLFRYPSAVIVLFLAIVLFGLAMLDVVTISLPSAVTNRQGAGTGVFGSLGMGFFAAILSIPCSGALLGFVLVWAQTQPRLVSSTAIVLMGVGMALPYAVIVAIPSLLRRVPKPGMWMEIFKKSTGFLLLFIAVKLTLAALPKDRLLNVLTYGILLSFCVWMWSKWVGFSTPPAREWTVRLVAVLLATGGALWLLPAPPGASIDWQPYDASVVQAAQERGQPVLLKFTADWCANCKVLERSVYQDPQVARLIREKGVLPIKADTTLFDYPATIDMRKVYGEAGNVPVTIILPPHGDMEKIRGIFEKARLIEVLKNLPEEPK
jgi:thiol:disulfide interchange protein